MPTTTGNWTDMLAKTADQILAGDVEHVLLGPIVRDDDNASYFVVGTTTEDGEFHVDQLKAHKQDLARQWRDGIRMALIQRRPIVIHEFDDELEMAKWAAAICPGEKTARILEGIRRERGMTP